MSILPGTRTPGLTGGALDPVQRLWTHVLVLGDLGTSLTLSEPQHCHP